VAAGSDRWLLTVVRGHLGDTRQYYAGQGLGGTGLLRDSPFFRPDVSPVRTDRASVYALPPVAGASRWLLLLLSPLLSAQCEWFGAELLLGDHRRALGFPAVFCRSKRARTCAPVSQIAITD